MPATVSRTPLVGSLGIQRQFRRQSSGYRRELSIERRMIVVYGIAGVRVFVWSMSVYRPAASHYRPAASQKSASARFECKESVSGDGDIAISLINAFDQRV